MQGYFADAYHFLPNKNTMPIYIGTHFCEFAQEFLLHLLSFDRGFFKHLEIGARDEFTMAFCDRIGLKSYLSRCLTLTLDKRDEKLEYKKVFFVNFDKKYLKFVPKDLLKNAEFINQKSNSTSNEPFLQEYWFEKAQDFKSKIMQKYVRMTLLRAQKAYTECNYEVDLDDVTQIYLQIMSKAIDRCDSRFGVLTTFIQSWLKSAKAIVQQMVKNKQHSTSYEGLIEEFGDSANFGSTFFDSSFDTLEELSYVAQKIDRSGCLRLRYKIPQYMSLSNRKILENHATNV